jgi:formylglycine-generating enzyme required for sulfatase activity
MDRKIIGDYSLIKELGKGTFGSVYLAEHRYIKKRYAIKILSRQFSSNEEFIARFDKEIGLLTRLDHPSIIKVHNISLADDHYFIVMDSVVSEKFESNNLDHYLSTTGKIISEKKVETILRQVASALDYAHDTLDEGRPLLHRGLKPSNIFVDESEKGMRVLISDFGICKIIGEDNVLSKSYENLLSNLSKGEVFNNFYFLSPEQKRRKELNIGCDIYAFGVLAYYLITREFPEGYFELPSKFAPEYKLNWDLLICKCLQKDSKKRPERLTEAINSYLSSTSSSSSSMDVLSWEEVERKVENAMQMSFEFSPSFDNPRDTVANVNIEEDHNQNSENKSPEHRPIIKPQKIDRPNYEPDPSAIFQKELNVSYYTPKEEKIVDVEPILTEMVIIPGGTYQRGSNNGARDEMPAHMVTMRSFALDIHPVTNEQFVRFLESMGGEKDSNNNDIIRLRDSRIKRIGGSLTIESGYLKHPVVGVTWYGAMAYAKWVGKRLPSEAEWEIASAGGLEDAIYPTGKKIDHTQANFFSSDTTAVMSYPANGFGLYDMTGNVYEWCNDWYAYNYYDTSVQEPESPTGPLQGVYRVLRGGCWKSLKEDLRCAHRHRNNPGAFNSTYGFRCAADVS